MSYTGNESPKWRSKVSTKANVDRRIFENSPIQKDALSESKNQTSLKTRKRPSLSFGLNTTRLKQSTLNFSRVSSVPFPSKITIFINSDVS